MYDRWRRKKAEKRKVGRDGVSKRPGELRNSKLFSCG
jgi:hypothetical protein